MYMWETAIQRCSQEKVFWKYAIDLQENTHAEVRFFKNTTGQLLLLCLLIYGVDWIKLQSSANYLEQIKENLAKETVLENLISVFACLFLRCYLTYF